MPWWAKPSFYYEPPVTPARDQLDQAGIAVPRIILQPQPLGPRQRPEVDFPEAEVWITAEERDWDRHPGFPRASPSQGHSGVDPLAHL